MLLNKDRFGKLTSKSLDSIAAVKFTSFKPFSAQPKIPCLIYTNNSIILSPKTARKPLNPADSMQLKTIISLRQNVEYFIEKYGYNNVGFLTLTFRDHVTDPNSEGIGRYVGKYISKGIESRTEQFKGVRLVGYSRKAKIASTRFQFVSDGSYEWRRKLSIFVHYIADNMGCEPTFDGLRRVLGSRWSYHWRDFIMNIEESTLFNSGLLFHIGTTLTTNSAYSFDL